MKYLAIFIVFVSAVLMVHAQTSNSKIYSYKQKRLNDTLKMLFPDLQTSNVVSYDNGVYVLQLNNWGTKVGSNDRGDVYKMEVDNMRLLKPFKTQDGILSPIKRTKPLLVTPDEKH
jgi:hypothetical protein